MKESKWIYFTDQMWSGKTKRFYVHAKHGDFKLGEIKWYSSWRKYAFFPESHTVFEPTCLSDISDFIKGLMAERKAVKTFVDRTGFDLVDAVPETR